MQMRSSVVVVVGRSGISHIICLLDHACKWPYSSSKAIFISVLLSNSTPSVNHKPQNPKVSELTSSKCQVQVNKDPRFTAEILKLRDFRVSPARALTSKNMLDFCAFMLMKPNISPNRII